MERVKCDRECFFEVVLVDGVLNCIGRVFHRVGGFIFRALFASGEEAQTCKGKSKKCEFG